MAAVRENKRYKVGSLYYECGIVPDLNGSVVPWIQTWVYMGYVRRNCSSTSCDVPYHFYHFKEFEPGMAHTRPEEWDATGIYVPSLRQAMMTKLTWKQMQGYGLLRLVQEYKEHIEQCLRTGFLP